MERSIAFLGEDSPCSDPRSLMKYLDMVLLIVDRASYGLGQERRDEQV